MTFTIYRTCLYISSQIVMMKKHNYQTNLTWTGNQGLGTKKYNSYTKLINVFFKISDIF